MKLMLPVAEDDKHDKNIRGTTRYRRKPIYSCFATFILLLLRFAIFNNVQHEIQTLITHKIPRKKKTKRNQIKGKSTVCSMSNTLLYLLPD